LSKFVKRCLLHPVAERHCRSVFKSLIEMFISYPYTKIFPIQQV
jgi:hypothetical protein